MPDDSRAILRVTRLIRVDLHIGEDSTPKTGQRALPLELDLDNKLGKLIDVGSGKGRSVAVITVPHH